MRYQILIGIWNIQVTSSASNTYRYLKHISLVDWSRILGGWSNVKVAWNIIIYIFQYITIPIGIWLVVEIVYQPTLVCLSPTSFSLLVGTRLDEFSSLLAQEKVRGWGWILDFPFNPSDHPASRQQPVSFHQNWLLSYIRPQLLPVPLSLIINSIFIPFHYLSVN